ncbi:MAG: substrate-binding domain-containing protein, partial [Armatimonadetes bacterium]|nr:substrate-binding domain-containing protein [Armatimonadota bacterium]NCO96128.1 substrate-binding domain-containing protein [Armatimonadota bacterium]
MSSRILLRVGLAVLVGAGVLGCSKPQESTEAPTGAKRSEEAQPRRKLAFVTNNASDFWTIARAGCDKATEELDNVEVDFRIPQDGQAMTQRQQIDDLLARGVDGIAVSPIDPANQTEYLNGVAKKTLL